MPRICITAPNKTPQPYRFPLDTEVVTIGRSAGCNVVIEHGSISSHHCEMRRVKGGFILADCDSTNGIHLEKTVMEVIDLKDGLDVEVGDVIFNYQLKEEEIEELAGERFRSLQKKKKPKKPPTAPKSPPKVREKVASPAMPAATVHATEKNHAARDFSIFLACAVVALFAFLAGLNNAYRETFPKDERRGKSVWKDKIRPSSSGPAPAPAAPSEG